MKKVVLVTMAVALTLVSALAWAETITVLDDEFNFLTDDEIASGVVLDPDTLFAYRILDDNTVELVRYCWYHADVYIPEEIKGLPVSCIGDYIFLDTPVKNVYLPDMDIHISDAAFDYFGGTVWLSARHPTLKFVMAIVNRNTYQIEYYRDTETILSAPTFRYWIEINDYGDDEE